MKIKTMMMVVVGVTLVAATTAWCGHAGGGRHGAGRHHGLLGPQLLASLGLSNTQQADIDAIRNSYESLFGELHDQAKTARQQIDRRLLADEFDEAAIRQACQAAALIDEDLAVLRGKMIAEIKSVLTDAQIALLKERIEARLEAIETLDN